MSKAIQLTRDETIQTVEQHLRALRASTGEMELWLPSDIPERIGVDVSLLQLLMTWSQSQDVPSLRTHVLFKDAGTALDRACENVVGLSAMTLSKAISSWDKQDVRTSAHTAASQQVDAMASESAKFQRGSSFAVLCFDGTTKAYPRNVYHEATRDVRAPMEFEALFKRRLRLAESSSSRRGRIEEVATRLGTIVFETFRNTHQWGRTTVDDVPIRKGVRGVLMRRYRDKASTLAERHEQDAPLADFLSQHITQEPSERSGVLELSVFDGGPGLVRRYRNTSNISSLSLESERASCLECFDKHRTSSGMAHRGMGLYAAMRELSKLGGFVRLRTGRLSLYRNFATDPFQEGEASRLLDWPHPEGAMIADAAGVVLTFVLPIPEEEKFS